MAITVQIHNGEWTRVKGFTHEVCCDCGLEHKLEYRLNDGMLEYRSTREEKGTRENRAKHRYPCRPVPKRKKLLNR